MKTIILIISLFFSIHNSPTKISISNHLIQADTSVYAILKFDTLPDYIFDKSYKPAELTVFDINKIENLINEAVKKHNKEANKYFQIKNPSRYYKQFIAVTNSKGEKEIWVNCFCEADHFAYWKKSIVSVLDGGTCFFQLKINLTKNTTYDFGVNGVA